VLQGLTSLDMMNFLTSRQFTLPAVFVLSVLVLGIVLERILLTVLGRLWSRKGWDGWQTVRKSLRGMVTLWFVIGGAYASTRLAALDPMVRSIYHDAFLALIVFTMSLVIARILAGLLDLYISRAEGAFPSTTILGNIVRITVMLTGILVILKIMDVPITPILTALGVGGFAVALAFQDTLSNLFSGLHILASKQVRPGDYVELDTGNEGYVVDVTWRNTTIRTLPNNVVVIPNSKLATTVLTNYHRPVKEFSVLVDVGVGYDSDLERVENVTLDIAREVLREVHGGVTDFEPHVFYKEFSDIRIIFTVVLRAEEYVDQYRLKHEFIKRLHERYRLEGIEIPSLVTTVYLEPSRR
jgi:small-conductance mechanosensitive channel